MVVLDWAALSTLDKREIYDLSDEEIGPPLVIVVSPDARGELREIPENRIWCVVEEPVAQGELNNILKSVCLSSVTITQSQRTRWWNTAIIISLSSLSGHFDLSRPMTNLELVTVMRGSEDAF